MTTGAHMTDNSVNPTPPKNPDQPAAPAAQGSTPRPKGENFFARPMTFLGMKFTGPEAQKLWNIIIQNINSAIQKAQDRAMKALQKLKKSETGDESSDN